MDDSDEFQIDTLVDDITDTERLVNKGSIWKQLIEKYSNVDEDIENRFLTMEDLDYMDEDPVENHDESVESEKFEVEDEAIEEVHRNQLVNLDHKRDHYDFTIAPEVLAKLRSAYMKKSRDVEKMNLPFYIVEESLDLDELYSKSVLKTPSGAKLSNRTLERTMSVRRAMVGNNNSSSFATPIKQSSCNDSRYITTTPTVVLDKFRLNNEPLSSPQFVLPSEIQRLFSQGKTNFSFSVKEREYSFQVQGSPFRNASSAKTIRSAKNHRTPKTPQQQAIASMDGSDTDSEIDDDNTECANLVKQFENSSPVLESIDLTIDDEEEPENVKPKQEIMENHKKLVNVRANIETKNAQEISPFDCLSQDLFKYLKGKTNEEVIDKNKKSDDVFFQSQTKKWKFPVAPGSSTARRNEVQTLAKYKTAQNPSLSAWTPQKDEQIEKKLAEAKPMKERQQAFEYIGSAISTAPNENESRKHPAQHNSQEDSTKIKREKLPRKTPHVVKKEYSDEKLQHKKLTTKKFDRAAKTSKSSTEESSEEDILFQHLASQPLKNVTNKKSDSDTEGEEDVFFRPIQQIFKPKENVSLTKCSQFPMAGQKRSSKNTVDSSLRKFRK